MGRVEDRKNIIYYPSYIKINHINHVCVYRPYLLLYRKLLTVSLKFICSQWPLLSLSPFLCLAALPHVGRHFPAVLDVYLTFDVVAVCPRAWGPIKTNNPRGPLSIPRTHPLSLLFRFVSPITFPLLHSSSQLIPSCSPATVHLCSSLISSFVILASLSFSYPSSLFSFIRSPSSAQEWLPCFAVSSSFSVATWHSIFYGRADFALPFIWVIVLVETSEFQFQHIAHFRTWYTACFMWRQYPELIYSI